MRHQISVYEPSLNNKHQQYYVYSHSQNKTEIYEDRFNQSVVWY